MPTRGINNHLITSDSLPQIKVQVNETLEYIGTKIFSMGEVVEVEVFVFVETEDNKVTRRLVIHFERVLDGVESPHQMRIPTPLTHELGGELFYTDMRCFRAEFFRDYKDSDDDWAHVYRMIETKGYQPPNYKSNILIKRLGQIIAPDNTAEFLIIYTEPLDDGILEPSSHNTYLVTDRQRHLIADFEQRALDSFTIIADE